MWARSDQTRDSRRFRWRGTSYALFSDRGRIGIDNSPALEAFAAEQRRKVQAWLLEERRLMSYLTIKDEDGPRTTFVENSNLAARAIRAQPPPALLTHSLPYWWT